MQYQFFRFLMFLFIIVGCSPSMLKVERAVAPGTLTVIQLSDNGAIEQTLDQLSLTEPIAGPLKSLFGTDVSILPVTSYF